MLTLIKPALLVDLPSLSLFSGRIPAGFPSPADDFIDNTLDLNSYLVKRPSSTFFMRMSGSSMTGDGISSGDILVVDRSLDPQDGWVIVAAIQGELVVKKYKQEGKKSVLTSNNGETLSVSEDIEFEVWGVVTSVIHTFGKK